MRKLTDTIRNIASLDDTTESAILAKFKVEELKKGQLLLKEGRICNKLWFIISGTIRQYMIIDGVGGNQMVLYRQSMGDIAL